MSRASARVEAQALKRVLLKAGVPEVSIELVQGRPTSGDEWNAQFVVSDFAHHTASRFSATNRTPCLSLVKRGRSDLPGPLCNGYGGWDLCARIITLGYANHPGEGGPMRVPSGEANPSSYTIPRNDARRYAFGWEFEGGINEDDWDKVLTNPRNGKKMNFHEFMARCLNGTQAFYELPLGSHAEHKTWAPSRKIDRVGYDKNRGIALMKRHQGPAVDPGDVVIDLSSVADQFRIAVGAEKGKIRRLRGIKDIQKQLNKRYDAGLKVDGLVDEKTADAWGDHEEKIGVKERPRVPDKKSLDALMPNSVVIKP